MQVKVRYFAALREWRGCDGESVELAEKITVEQLYHRLFPPRQGQRLPVMYAINHHYVSANQVVEAGDEVAFIPPVGGG